MPDAKSIGHKPSNPDRRQPMTTPKPPNYRDAECCYVCKHWQFNSCGKYCVSVYKDFVCDDYEPEVGDNDKSE